jgi:hypothetical protein
MTEGTLGDEATGELCLPLNANGARPGLRFLGYKNMQMSLNKRTEQLNLHRQDQDVVVYDDGHHLHCQIKLQPAKG